MKGVIVQRLYLLSMMVTLTVVAWVSFTQPMKSTARPQVQAQLYAQVPLVKDADGKPPVPSPAKGPGSALAYLQIPRFGENWMWTVVEGTAVDSLAEGPGHYAGTPLMGQKGKMAVAGHRAGHGDPFIDFDLLRVGDEITFRQSGAWWTYTITKGPVIIEPDTLRILRQPPNIRKLVLTTCWPKYGNAKRMFVAAMLTDWSGK